MKVNRTLTMATIGLLTAIGGVFVAPGAASAEPWNVPGEANDAVASTGPIGDYACAYTTGAIACFKSYGDTWYVKDTLADGKMAVADWISYASADDDEPIDRFGECHNHFGAGQWGECPKNYVESHYLTFRAQAWNPTTNVFSTGPWLFKTPAAG